MAALGAAVAVGGMAVALIAGLAVHFAPASPPPLEAIVPTRNSPPPPEPTPSATPSPARTTTPRPAGGGGSPARPMRAPHPDAAPPAPPLILSSPLPAIPADGSSGTGPVGGSGGSGNGSGNGSGTGDGPGYGSGAGMRQPPELPRQIKGKLHFSDLPPELRQRRAGDVLTLRYRIGTDGLVSGCTVVASSGDPALDAQTCALITQRFRFRPARDVNGNAVPFTMTEIHGWDNAPASP